MGSASWEASLDRRAPTLIARLLCDPTRQWFRRTLPDRPGASKHPWSGRGLRHSA